MISEYRRIKNIQRQDPFKGYEFSTQPTGKNAKYEFYYSKFDKPEEHLVQQNMRRSINFLDDRNANLSKSLIEARRFKEPERDLLLMSDLKQAQQKQSEIDKIRSQSTENHLNSYSLEKENRPPSRARDVSTPSKRLISEMIDSKDKNISDQLPKLDFAIVQKVKNDHDQKKINLNDFKKDVKNSIIYRYKNHKPSFDEFYREKRSVSQSRGTH